jgi:hypothetical protein
MAEDRVQELLAEVEKYKRYLAQLANTCGKQFRSLKHELTETKEQLESSEDKVRELEAENYSLRPEETIIPTCHQVRENGRLCRSAAVKGRHYCKHHLGLRGRRLKMAARTARSLVAEQSEPGNNGQRAIEAS